ncbi:MAG TPA: hypothetical protein DCS23_02660 [Candidatus Yonathbacteria bacterium]|nr:hypothetical protein [Candidatus Yonathbacteria bacterium]
MDGSNPKVSFIPKGSLVREESFLERRRPQSAIGLLSGIVFVLIVSSFVGLYYYNNKLNLVIVEKTMEIDEAKQKFKDVPEVAEARVFRARVDLANDLLNAHRVVSPVFAFLSDNTTESILYDKFSFKSDSSGATLDIGGEAQNYASLAFQADVLRGKTDELLEFSIDNISLTKFGSITFNLALVFKPDFLLYTKNVGGSSDTESQARESATDSTPAIIPPVSEEETVSVSIPEVVADTNVADSESVPQTTVTDSLSGDWTTEQPSGVTSTPDTSEPSMLRKLWLRLKFW